MFHLHSFLTGTESSVVVAQHPSHLHSGTFRLSPNAFMCMLVVLHLLGAEICFTEEAKLLPKNRPPALLKQELDIGVCWHCGLGLGVVESVEAWYT